MKLFIGTDHNGFDLKQRVVAYLKEQGYDVVDDSDETPDPADDFPVFASRVVHDMRGANDDARGILLCGSGQGMVIAANRFKGIRAGLGWSVDAAKGIRNDEDSNVLALPAELFSRGDGWQAVVDAWLHTPYANADRFNRRNQQLDDPVWISG